MYTYCMPALFFRIKASFICECLCNIVAPAAHTFELSFFTNIYLTLVSTYISDCNKEIRQVTLQYYMLNVVQDIGKKRNQ